MPTFEKAEASYFAREAGHLALRRDRYVLPLAAVTSGVEIAVAPASRVTEVGTEFLGFTAGLASGNLERPGQSFSAGAARQYRRHGGGPAAVCGVCRAERACRWRRKT